MILKRRKSISSRQLKVTNVIRKAISQILLKNDLPLIINFEFPLSVINVEMSSDLRIAYVYVSTHEDIVDHEVIKKLDSCKSFIASKINQNIDLKFTPKIIFRNDKDIDIHEKISKLLNSDKVRMDIKK